MKDPAKEARSILNELLRLRAGEFEMALRDQDWTETMAGLLLKYELNPGSPSDLTKEEICQLRDFFHIFASRLNAASAQRLESTLIASHSVSYPVSPPFNAEYLLILFLGKQERDIVIGDLIECYFRVVQQFGKRRADLWFYKQVAGSLLPLVRRALLKIGALVWLGRILRRLVS